jgi:hypothetical protein
MSEPELPPAERPRRCPVPGWVRKLGVAGTMFFLIKGLLWLLIPALAVAWKAFSD